MRAILISERRRELHRRRIASAKDANHAQPSTTANQTSSKRHTAADLRNMLQKSGYTEIRVAPTSFMVRAKDFRRQPGRDVNQS